MWHVTPLLFLLSLLLGSGASTSLASQEDGGRGGKAAPADFERQVQRRLAYVDERLLSGRAVSIIEKSESEQAKSILRLSREKRKKIARFMAQRKYQEADRLLREIGKEMRIALRLARKEEFEERKARERMDEARVVNDIHFQRITRRNVERLENREIMGFIEEARAARRRAEQLRVSGDYDAAASEYARSSRFLKKAFSLFKRRRRD